MTDNPYINKQNWGRDLLDRLNNFSDDDGSFNVWEELPTLGKNGQPLGQEHAGYTGFFQQEQGVKIVCWDGYKWDTLLSSPYTVDGETEKTVSTELTAFAVTANIVSFSDSFVYAVSQSASGSGLIITKLNKSTLEVVWASNIALYNASFPNYKYSTINKDAQNIYFALHFTNVSESAYVTQLISLSDTSGALFWAVAAGSNNWQIVNTLVVGTTRVFTATSESRIYSWDKNNGSLIASIDVSGQRLGSVPTGSNIVRLFLDESNDNLILAASPASPLSSISSPVFFVYNLSNLSLVRTLDTFSSPERFTIKGIVQHFGDKKYFFLWMESSAFVRTFFRYNSVSNSLDFISNSPKLLGTLVGMENTASLTPTLYSAQDKVLSKIIYENNKYIFDRTFYPGGEGTLLIPNTGQARFQDDFVSIKTESVVFGYAVKIIKLFLHSSSSARQVITWQNASLLFGDATSLIDEVTFQNCFIEKATLKKTKQDYIKLTGNPNGTSLESSCSKEDAGINFADQMYLFSLYGNASANSGINIPSGSNYTDGRMAVGLAANCMPIAGRFINMGSSVSGTWGASGLFFFDLSAGRWILHSGARIAGFQQELTSFPSANGLCLDFSNNLGIGTLSPAFKLDVIGTIRGTEIRNSGGVITSDPRLKTNMTSLNGGELWEICQLLNPITFVYKPDFEVEIQEFSKDEDGNDVVVNTSKSRWPLPQGIQYGYNALEVEELLPELVDEDPQGIKYLNNGALFPIFQSAATAKIQSLESEVETLKQLVQSLVARIEALENA